MLYRYTSGTYVSSQLQFYHIFLSTDESCFCLQTLEAHLNLGTHVCFYLLELQTHASS